ncbi:hypothetical protein ACIKTA_10200 [Hansschlegelia beijingensis]
MTNRARVAPSFPGGQAQALLAGYDRSLAAPKGKAASQKSAASRKTPPKPKTAPAALKRDKVKIDLKPALKTGDGAQPVPGSIYRNAAPANGKSAF